MIFLISKYDQVDCVYDDEFFNINICKQNDYRLYE
jgi:hypothetical protein